MIGAAFISVATGLLGLYLAVRGIRITQNVADEYWGTSGLAVGGITQVVGYGYLIAAAFNFLWAAEGGGAVAHDIPLWALILISLIGICVGVIYGTLLRLIPRDGLRGIGRGAVERADPPISWQNIPFEHRFGAYALVVAGLLVSAVRALPS